MIFPHCVWIGLFIDSDQAGFLLHANIARDQFIITDHWQFAIHGLKFRHRVGDEIMMRHRCHGQLQPTPFAHLPCVGTACIDYMFTGDVTLFR